MRSSRSDVFRGMVAIYRLGRKFMQEFMLVFSCHACKCLCKRRPNGLVGGTIDLRRTLVKNVNHGNGSHEEFLAAGENLYQLDGRAAGHFA